MENTTIVRPEDVLEATKLSREEKIRLLRRFEYDAREMEVAEEEGMSGGADVGGLLQRTLDALRTLGVEPDHTHSAPTKQNGG